jgi:predicted small lipoprotein YifL
MDAMKLRHALRLLVLAAAVTALAGCGVRGKRGPGEVAPGGSVVPAPAKLKFLITITPSRFAIGERVSLEASLFNEGEKAYEQSCPTSCVWDYEVTTLDGQRVGPARECLSEKTELRLEPGELRMIMRNWSGRDHFFGAAERLVPGTYLVTAGFVDGDGRVVPMMEAVEVQVVKGR